MQKQKPPNRIGGFCVFLSSFNFLSSFKQKFGCLQSAISTSPIGYALQEWIYPNISSAWRSSTPLGINTLPETSFTLQREHSPLRQHTLTLTPARSSAHKMDSLHFASIILSPTLSLKTSLPVNSCGKPGSFWISWRVPNISRRISRGRTLRECKASTQKSVITCGPQR